jgi:prepilin-type N-terminal cleavage/methylation domain-containing protein
MAGMRKIGGTRSPRGFSLIEVLIAVVVLSVGLLALAALQMSVTRSAAEAKGRSAAVRVAQEQLETIRSIGPYQLDPANPDLPAFGALVGDKDIVTLDGVEFSRSWTVDFCTIAADGATACSDVGSDVANFARVVVNVTWTGPDGVSKNVELQDTVSSLSPLDVTAALTNTTSTRKPPIIRLKEKRLEGTIPIAIGDSKESASSDPQPSIFQANRARTQFEVVVYSRDGDNIIGRRAFEYTAIGCDCTLQAPTANIVSYEPTFWNGLAFTRPREIKNADVGRQHGLPNLPNNSPDAIEELCTACCRDHHDYKSFAPIEPEEGDDPSSPVPLVRPKVNPLLPAKHELCEFTNGGRTVRIHPNDWRETDPVDCSLAANIKSYENYSKDNNFNHLHFNPVLRDGRIEFDLALKAGDSYYEVCRFVRRDGVFRLTQDARIENLEIFKRSDLLALADGVEENQYSKFAAEFVDKYIDEVVKLGDKYPAEVPDVRALAKTAADKVDESFKKLLRAGEGDLDAINNSLGTQMVARAIFIDPLNETAVRGIKCKIANDETSDECLPYVGKTKLELVPFFAINLTQLAGWSTSNSGVIRMGVQRDNKNQPIPFSGGIAVPVENGSATIFGEALGGNAALSLQIPPTPDAITSQFVDQALAQVTDIKPVPKIIVKFMVTVDKAVPSGTNQDAVSPTLTAAGGGAVNCVVVSTKGQSIEWACELNETGGTGSGAFELSNYTGRLQTCEGKGKSQICRTSPVNTKACVSPAFAPVISGDFLFYSEKATFKFDQAAPATFKIDIKLESDAC